MYDQVKKSWAKQSVALDVSTFFFGQNHMQKALIFIKGKKKPGLGMRFHFYSFVNVFIGA